MSIWDKLSGRKTSSTKGSNSETSKNNSSFADSIQNTSSFDPQSTQDVSSILISPSFADPSQLHPLAGLNQQTLDYLSLEDSALSDLPGSQSALPSRGWSDDLCYGTGVTYLTALTVGGAWGLQEGLRRSVGQPPKLRLNSALNAITRRGPFLGNSAGVIALVYNGINSFIGNFRGKHDSVNSVVAGALSGMLFKSTRGVRPMMISGSIVATVAGAWAAPRVVHLQPVCAHPGLLYLDPFAQLPSNNTSTHSAGQDSATQPPSKPPAPPYPSVANMCDSNGVRQRQLDIARNLRMADAQAHEMKPCNQEPNTMYWFREKSGEYVQHPFRTIDGGDLGKIRWYRHKDLFYATAV